MKQLDLNEQLLKDCKELPINKLAYKYKGKLLKLNDICDTGRIIGYRKDYTFMLIVSTDIDGWTLSDYTKDSNHKYLMPIKSLKNKKFRYITNSHIIGFAL